MECKIKSDLISWMMSEKAFKLLPFPFNKEERKMLGYPKLPDENCKTLCKKCGKKVCVFDLTQIGVQQ